MKTDLNFEETETKKLLSKLEFDFFLKQHIEIEKYPQTDIDNIYLAYNSTSILLKSKAKINKKQFKYLMEGKVRKMFTGGFLPTLFELDKSRSHRFFDFPAIGENWAYFDYWQKYYKRKITREKVWDLIIKVGSILAIILSIIKLLEIILK